jgi:hypothetical protein
MHADDAAMFMHNSFTNTHTHTHSWPSILRRESVANSDGVPRLLAGRHDAGVEDTDLLVLCVREMGKF